MALVLSTASWIDGKNHFISIAYVAVGLLRHQAKVYI
jgi:hypothetical protein